MIITNYKVITKEWFKSWLREKGHLSDLTEATLDDNRALTYDYFKPENLKISTGEGVDGTYIKLYSVQNSGEYSNDLCVILQDIDYRDGGTTPISYTIDITVDPGVTFDGRIPPSSSFRRTVAAGTDWRGEFGLDDGYSDLTLEVDHVITEGTSVTFTSISRDHTIKATATPPDGSHTIRIIVGEGTKYPSDSPLSKVVPDGEQFFSSRFYLEDAELWENLTITVESMNDLDENIMTPNTNDVIISRVKQDHTIISSATRKNIPINVISVIGKDCWEVTTDPILGENFLFVDHNGDVLASSLFNKFENPNLTMESLTTNGSNGDYYYEWTAGEELDDQMVNSYWTFYVKYLDVVYQCVTEIAVCPYYGHISHLPTISSASWTVSRLLSDETDVEARGFPIDSKTPVYMKLESTDIKQSSFLKINGVATKIYELQSDYSQILSVTNGNPADVLAKVNGDTIYLKFTNVTEKPSITIDNNGWIDCENLSIYIEGEEGYLTLGSYKGADFYSNGVRITITPNMEELLIFLKAKLTDFEYELQGEYWRATYNGQEVSMITRNNMHPNCSLDLSFKHESTTYTALLTFRVFDCTNLDAAQPEEITETYTWNSGFNPTYGSVASGYRDPSYWELKDSSQANISLQNNGEYTIEVIAYEYVQNQRNWKILVRNSANSYNIVNLITDNQIKDTTDAPIEVLGLSYTPDNDSYNYDTDAPVTDGLSGDIILNFGQVYKEYECDMRLPSGWLVNNNVEESARDADNTFTITFLDSNIVLNFKVVDTV